MLRSVQVASLHQVGDLIALIAEDGEDWKEVAEAPLDETPAEGTG